MIASAFLEVKLRPRIDYFNWYCFVVPGNHKLCPLIDYLLASGMEKSEEFTTFWSDSICKIVKGMKKILSYALKMKQDYLSTCYLEQFISPSFRCAHSGDIFDPSN